MKRRIIFVGIHNKPGKTPLDSTTKSGKRIDKIIDNVNLQCAISSIEIEFVKTNLWEVERHPLIDEQMELEILWHIKYDPKPNDIIVLLGGIVQRNFPKIISKNLLYFPHPSLQYSKIKELDYIINSCSLINNRLTINH